MHFYSFYKNDALRFGVEKAVLLYHIAYWIYMNQANNRHFYEGAYWTYNSAKAFKNIFPFWECRKISRMLNELENDGIIKSGNFNNVAYDRTKWYSIIDKSIGQICQMDLSEVSSRFDSTDQPIPDNNQIITNQSTKIENGKQRLSGSELEHYSRLKQELEMVGWIGDFDKLIFSLGGIEVVGCYWENHLSKMICRVSPECRGGYITKRFAADALVFYQQHLQEKKQVAIKVETKHKMESPQAVEDLKYLRVIENGTKAWQALDADKRIAVFQKIKDKYSFLEGALDYNSGEITGDLICKLIYEELGTTLEVKS